MSTPGSKLDPTNVVLAQLSRTLLQFYSLPATTSPDSGLIVCLEVHLFQHIAGNTHNDTVYDTSFLLPASTAPVELSKTSAIQIFPLAVLDHHHHMIISLACFSRTLLRNMPPPQQIFTITAQDLGRDCMINSLSVSSWQAFYHIERARNTSRTTFHHCTCMRLL